jgi:hypothetical protein
MNIQEAIAAFDTAEAESLAVVETDGRCRPVGILTEAHAMRRYSGGWLRCSASSSCDAWRCARRDL